MARAEEGLASEASAPYEIAVMTRSRRASGAVGALPANDTKEPDVRARAIEVLQRANVPFLVAGAYALRFYTGVSRDTKDLDVCLRKRDVPRAFRALEAAGFRTEMCDACWLGKAYLGESFIDLIFSSRNGLGPVDDLWFRHARHGEVLGRRCAIVPPEEMIFSKSFVEERERYDGADIHHLIYACGHEMDWRRLLDRFGPYWELLFAHVSQYRFVYPGARSQVPDWLIEHLCHETLTQMREGDTPPNTCRGRLISKEQYQYDYEERRMVG